MSLLLTGALLLSLGTAPSDAARSDAEVRARLSEIASLSPNAIRRGAS